MSLARTGLTGLIPPEQLGYSPASSKYLRGDGTWQPISGGGGGDGNVDGGTPDSIYGGSIAIDGGGP